MPKLLLTWDEVSAVIGKQQVIELDGVDYVDVLGLIDVLRELAGFTPPAVFQVGGPAPDRRPKLVPATASRPGEACPHCGATAGSGRWDDDADSRYCLACGRHWRTGHTEEVWRGIRGGAVGPAPEQVPAAPLGAPPDAVDPATRVAPRLARLPDLEPVGDYFPGEDDA